MIRYAPGDEIPGPDVVVARSLGSGGQGEVYLSWNTMLRHSVVIKLLNPELVGRDAQRMFEKEARLMTRLRHRNIVRVVTAGWTREELPRPYYIMDEEPGAVTLAELIAQRTPLAVLNVLSIGIQVCDALHKAHTLTGPDGQLLGAVHRDLKPANLLIVQDDDGNTVVKLLDFGIAWALHLVVTGAVSAMFHGTVAYAAPEQQIGRAVLQSDIYSLCVVLYELLAERHPYWDAADLNDMMACHRFHKARPLTGYVIGLPTRLVSLIAKNLEKDPSKRSQSAAELKTELEACAREVEQIKQARALDMTTTDNMVLEKRIEARKEENERSVQTAFEAIAERTGHARTRSSAGTKPTREARRTHP